MNRTQHRKQFRPPNPSEIMSAMNVVDDCEFDATKDGSLAHAHLDPEDSAILLAACRIVASGYKAEISRGQDDSLFVQAAYQLLHRFLEQQFARRSRAA